ncbi:FecR family protein [Williamwhitmania taraxaci]|uniref:FecR family protein n=1 Tax=Williamwhitmania taraxaci TaxID=1640674 RepID=A0A1G6LZ97_9BACT|nr:FecR family protein [Williamwhitmania taraxaci]SDC48437.1 FecR family protein [Williamwhitmania taraxaci]
MSLGNDNNPFYPEMGDDEALDKALKAMSSWSAPATKSKEEAWQQLMAGIDRPKEDPTEKPLAPVVTFRRRLVIYGSAAAALIAIILISTILLKLTGTIQVVAPFGAFANVELPDRSSVVLNSDSKLTYSKIGWDKHRKVSLQGEAIFEVTTGEKFEVHTPVGYVRVLGTKFNVNFRNKNLEVDCLRGKVEVVLASGRKELLVAGQGLNVDNEQLVVKKELNLQTDAKWIEGEFFL